jgi:multidrug efflux pump subunit AcrB
MLPGIEKTLPPGIKITPLNDASKFVRASVEDVVREMVTAAVLTGLMVLLFLGSWRSTLIVATSIPLCILTSIIVLSWLGQTINVMTLGGLALAVGILVDDATVMIENIATHLETGQELEPAIIDAANQIVVPTFVSLLCICSVWLPLFSLDGVGGYLFRPLAMAIVFAMIASFILSRTLGRPWRCGCCAGRSRLTSTCSTVQERPNQARSNASKGGSNGNSTGSAIDTKISSAYPSGEGRLAGARRAAVVPWCGRGDRVHLIDDGHYRRCRSKGRTTRDAGGGRGRLIRSNGSLRKALRLAHPLRRWRGAMP